MTLSRKIIALFVALVALACLLVTGAIAQREVAVKQQRIVERAESLTRSQTQLQLALYFGETGLQRALLDDYLASPAVRYAALFDPLGARLTGKQRDAARALPDYDQLRYGVDPVDTGLAYRNTGEWPSAPGFALTLFGLFGERITDVSVPVFSVVNPLETGIQRARFADLLTNADAVESLHVGGYVNLGISRPYLWSDTMPLIWRVLGACLLAGALCVLGAWLYIRRLTAPLSRLATMAEDIAQGKLDTEIRIRGGGEARQIATMLNTIIGSLNKYKARMDVDHQLLSMKVEERTAQLSKRNEELNQAVKEVTRTKEDLRKMAYYDSLTALPNRRLFTEQLSMLLRLAERQGSMLALLFLDLDNFKRINDSLGHSAGDLLLREVGNRLSSSVRESDIVAHYVESDSAIEVSRLGGDEFTVVLNQVDGPETVTPVAQRLLDALSAPMTIEGHELVITPSIGIAIGPRDAGNVEGLLKAADTAMYHAKKAGKNKFLFYDEGMSASNVERLQLENDLRKAIERNELVLHYQPQIDTSTGYVVGVEALVRWDHPEHGLIPPFKFIPLAEEMGLIASIGEWAIMEACRQVKAFAEDGLVLPKVAVNVSALEFSPALVGRVRNALAASGINPRALELELTEGVVLDNSSTTLQTLKSLKGLGIALAIDDFGTGYSSLSYLSRFPLDELKIDRSFVIDIDKGESNASLVVAIIAMAKSMKLRLVAEGVESEEQLNFLRRHGVDIIQGYLFAKPMAADELGDILPPHRFLDPGRTPVATLLQAGAEG
jgi:diguanylate cyclase (GGDEF)-like protein